MGAGGDVLGYTFWRLERWYDMQLLVGRCVGVALAGGVEYSGCLAEVGAIPSEEVQTVGNSRQEITPRSPELGTPTREVCCLLALEPRLRPTRLPRQYFSLLRHQHSIACVYKYSWTF